MLEKLKQLKQLKDLQSRLSREKAEVEKNGVRVAVNGKMEIEEIKLNPEISAEEQGKIVKDCVNEAMRKIQMSAAQKMFQNGNIF